VVTTPGAVWVANIGGPTVSRIDPKTGRVVATIRLGPHIACCSEHMTMAAGAGAVWVGVPGLYGVVRIDPAKNAVAAQIMLSGQPCGFMAADAEGVWAAGAHCWTDVMRIDPRTNKEAGAVKGEAAPIGLVLGFGSLWVEDLDLKRIDRVDPRTRRIVARLPLGGIPLQLAAGFGSLWARDDTGSVLRLQPRQR
jgi:streptogramin lyase